MTESSPITPSWRQFSALLAPSAISSQGGSQSATPRPVKHGAIIEMTASSWAYRDYINYLASHVGLATLLGVVSI